MKGTWEVRLLSASYTSDAEGKPYIELFGKTRERKSILIAVYDFKPYFYIVDPTPAAEEGLKNDDQVFALEHKTLEYKGEKHDTLKITLNGPWQEIGRAHV